VGVSGGMIVLWNSSVFSGLLIEVKWFGPMIRFTSVHDNSSWVLVCVYGLAKGWRGIILCPGYIIFRFLCMRIGYYWEILILFDLQTIGISQGVMSMTCFCVTR
jgi:hypothetical protein